MSEPSSERGATCAICLTAIEAGEARTACASCASPYHQDCWSENGGCAVYGCALVPKTEGLKPLEIPPAFWGKEDKACPLCGASIMAVAVRCRHCGGEVEARPEEKAAFERRAGRKARLPALRRAALVFLAMSLLPGFSLITLIGGGIYYRSHRDEIRCAPSGTDGFFRIAVATAAAQCAILLLGLAAWWIHGAVL